MSMQVQGELSLFPLEALLHRQTIDGLYEPRDVELAYLRHKATCGPAALAALLGYDVCEVMQFFRKPREPKFPGWCNARMMTAAIEAAGESSIGLPNTWPKRGVCWIQFHGPWMEHGVPFGRVLAHSHWVAVQGSNVYDVNTEYWESRESWEKGILKEILKSKGNRGSTGWAVRLGLEVLN